MEKDFFSLDYKEQSEILVKVIMHLLLNVGFTNADDAMAILKVLVNRELRDE